ncbi:beta-phosphoglucomutase [Streptomyces laurentii]|uniref:Beta-phosphoglucomutase n=1 Tax=Streptomyces laurentii TaxID=39478 RepID=A0A160NU78_STRLU|nr:beta-phosphoglucomutase [Streptomyces laurentii]
MPHAVVFDTDGVLLDSAVVHAAAWKTAFDAFLAEVREARGTPGPPDADGTRGTEGAPGARGTGEPGTSTAPPPAFPPASPPAPPDLAPFDEDADYRRHVDGKSRFDGAEAFLTARGIRLPPGHPDDPPGHDTVWAVAARKEAAFQDALAAAPLAAFPDAAEALTHLHALRIPCAAVSASRHARELLRATGLTPLLATVVDGVDTARLGLPGKPDPALFLHAAGLLGTGPGDAAVVEDALAGVRAGHRGGFRLVVGVDRTPDGRGAAVLRAEGADRVVPDLMTLVRSVWGEIR